MKVLHVTTNYPTPEHPVFGIFVEEQVESLRRRGIECDVFFCDGKGRGLKQYLSYLPRLWKKAVTGGYDIIHCHHALSAILVFLTGAPLFRKVVLSYQNDPAHEWGGTWFRIFHCCFRAIILKNPSAYLKYKKVTYLPNGCNELFFRPMDKMSCRARLGWDPDKRYVIFMDSNKGSRTQKRKDRFDAALRILEDKYGCHAEPVVMNSVKRELVPIYLNAADLHMISSDFEGSPNSVKECICCNTPVVSTDVGNVREMIGDIPGAYVVDSTAEALADACWKVLTSTGSFDGRSVLLAKGYGISDVAERLSGIYDSIIG